MTDNEIVNLAKTIFPPLTLAEMEESDIIKFGQELLKVKPKVPPEVYWNNEFWKIVDNGIMERYTTEKLRGTDKRVKLKITDDVVKNYGINGTYDGTY